MHGERCLHFGRYLRLPLCVAVLLLFLSLMPRGAVAGPDSNRAPLIAVASDLQMALPAIVQEFTAKTGQTVRLTFGASGNLTSQIRSGAPVELFLSADETLVFGLAADGLTEEKGTRYARGRLALLLPPGSAINPAGDLSGLWSALAECHLKRFAIANPAHAPYGARAREALISTGVWGQLENRVVLGENVAQTAQFVLTRAVDGGLVGSALVQGASLPPGFQAVLVREDLHTPLMQRMVLTKRAGPVARAFYDFLLSPSAREILARYGFAMPE